MVAGTADGGRRTDSAQAGAARSRHGWLALALGLAAWIALLDAVSGGSVVLIGLLFLPPVVAALRASRAQTAVVAGCSVGLAALLGFPNGLFGSVDHLARMFTVLTGSALALVLAHLRLRLERLGARSRSTLEAALDCVITIDGRGRVVDFNPAAERTFGYRRGEALGTELAELIVPPALRDRHREALARCVATGEGPILGQRLELPAMRADGSEFPAELTVTRIGGNGAPLFTGWLRDITERRRSEQGLRDSEERLRMIIDGVRDYAVFMLEPDGRVASWSAGAERTYGYRAEEIVGEHVFRLSAADRPELGEPELELSTAAAKGRFEGEGTSVRKDGTRFFVETVVASLREDDATLRGFVKVDRDITERVRADKEKELLEGRVRQSERLESVGQLAGGVAHDFNNLLSVILNYADLVAEELEERSPVRADVAEIRRAAERAAGLTRQLLLFSRREMVKAEVLNLNGVLTEMEKLLRRTLGEQIELVTRFAGDLEPVVADAGQIEQVVVNLAVNARDAMPAGGTLTIETDNAELDSDYARTHDVTPGWYGRLSVTDTGGGIGKEAIGRVFEPFFTTKPKGSGTGLGLATVYGIVKQAGGHIELYSELGLGTVFKIYLPVTGETPSVSVAADDSRAPAAHGETVLVVEDEDAVRELILRILSRQGYAVLEAGDASQGLRLWEERRGRIDLLVTDVVMPGMSGKELADQLGEQQADLEVLYISGYTGDVVLRQGVVGREARLLEKPFTARALLAAVGDALAAGRAKPESKVGSER